MLKNYFIHLERKKKQKNFFYLKIPENKFPYQVLPPKESKY